MALCKCDKCKTARKMERIIRTLPERAATRLRKYIHTLEDTTAMAEMDAAYYASIVSGDWPSSVRILTRALQAAIRKHGGRK